MLRMRAFLYLVMGDSLLILLAFAIPAELRGTLVSDPRWLVFSGPLLVIYHIVAVNIHGFSRLSLQSRHQSVWKAVQALLVAIALVTIVNFYAKAVDSFPRLTIASGSTLAMVAVGIFRWWFTNHLAAVVGGNPFSVILIRDGDAPMIDGPFSVVMTADAFFDPDRDDPIMYDRLASVLSSADRVVISCPIERRQTWALALRGANIQSEIVVPELATLSPFGVSRDLGMPSVIVANGPLGLFDRAIKRGFDIAVASVGLIVLSVPLIVVAIAIKFDSKGPVLFKQVRIGRGNQMFRMYKFRSMAAADADHAAATLTTRDDRRVTTVGRFIRRTSIDELPQLINVLMGDMSIVGPRPHALGARAADKLYWEVDSRYWDRHAAKPGLTGLAQVRGFRGATEYEDDLRQRLHADLEYLEHWSVWRDLRILFLTTRVLLHRNAF